MSDLIVIEGTDGSGKATQSDILYYYLQDYNRVLKVSYPNYESSNSTLVKKYLNGDYGINANDVNPYTASMFYAVDRVGSFMEEWKCSYENGCIDYVIADRYVPSNMIHQCTKFDTKEKKDRYIEWLEDLEYNKNELPRPSMTIFLDMPLWASSKLREGRDNKITGDSKQDIHEADQDHLRLAYDNGIDLARKLGWNIIKCTDGDRILSKWEIHDKIREELNI